LAIVSAPSDEFDLKIGNLNITSYSKIKDKTKDFLKSIIHLKFSKKPEKLDKILTIYNQL